MKLAKIHSDGRNTISCSSVFMCTRNTRSNISLPLTAGAAMLYFPRADAHLPAEPEELQQRDHGDDRNVRHIDSPLKDPILLLTDC